MDDLCIVGESDIGREELRCGSVQPYSVAHMNKPRLSWLYALNRRQRLGEREMRQMRVETQSVDYQIFHTFQLIESILRDSIGICDICHTPYPVAEYRQFVMHHSQGFYFHTLHHKCATVQRMQFKSGYSRILMVTETIRYTRFQSVEHTRLRINESSIPPI